MINTEKIWMNGKLVGHDDANIHVLSHVVHYGSSVFEGIRIYKTENGPAIFRLREHVKRLFDSAKVYRMDIPYSIEEIEPNRAFRPCGCERPHDRHGLHRARLRFR